MANGYRAPEDWQVCSDDCGEPLHIDEKYCPQCGGAAKTLVFTQRQLIKSRKGQRYV